MACWLVKSEPGDWSFEDQMAVEKEPWDGVRNAQAQANMRAMNEGDQVLFYHSGKGKEIVGLCVVAVGPYPDPDDPKGPDGKAVLVDLKATHQANTPVSLGAIKADGRFDDLALVRQARLSVMPIPDDAFQALADMLDLKAL